MDTQTTQGTLSSKVTYPDVAQVRIEARRAWEQQYQRRISFRARVDQIVPYGTVLIALVFFILSAPHTAEVFNLLVPVVGYIAPVGIEAGLFITAFQGFKAKQAGEHLKPNAVALEWLLVIVSVVCNGAGSFFRIMSEQESMRGLSITQLVKNFDTLPATAQVGFLLVPIAALVIPVGTIVSGSITARLVLEEKEHGNPLETAWSKVRHEIEFEALRDAAVSLGVSPGRAVRWAQGIVREASGVSAIVRTPAADSGRTADGQRTAEIVREASAMSYPSANGYNKVMDARTKVRQYLSDNPEAFGLSVRDLAAHAGVGKTVAAEVKASMNGNGGHGND